MLVHVQDELRTGYDARLGRAGPELQSFVMVYENSIRGTAGPCHQLVKPLQRLVEELEIVEVNVQY